MRLSCDCRDIYVQTIWIWGENPSTVSEKAKIKAFLCFCDTSNSDSGSDLVSLPGLITYVAPQVQTNERMSETSPPSSPPAVDAR